MYVPICRYWNIRHSEVLSADADSDMASAIRAKHAKDVCAPPPPPEQNMSYTPMVDVET